MLEALGGGGPEKDLPPVAALRFCRRQRAVDPALPEALAFGKKQAPFRPGNRSLGYGSSF